MKFIILLSVVAIASANPLFSGHGSASGSSSGGGGGAGIGKILAIPLGLKKQLLVSHQTRINKHFDHIISTLNKFSGNLNGGGSSSNSGSTAEGGASSSGTAPGTDLSYNGAGPETSYTGSDINKIDAGAGSQFESGFGDQQAVDFSSGSAHSTFSGSSSGSSNAALSGGFEGSVGFDDHSSFGGQGQGGNVQTYHPQPAPQVQYKEVPITVHLYQVEIPQAAAPAPQASFQQDFGPAVQQDQTFVKAEISAGPASSYGPPPAGPSNSYGPPPVAPIVPPTNTYGPPDYNPPAPISQPENTYLPPGGCHDARHRHRH